MPVFHQNLTRHSSKTNLNVSGNSNISNSINANGISDGMALGNTSAALVYKLCSHITGLTSDALTPSYQLVLRTLSCTSTAAVESDEFEVGEKIKKRLVKEKREKDALNFAELHRKLQGSVVLKNRWAILCFLLNLSGSKNKYQIKNGPYGFGFTKFATLTPLQNVGFYDGTKNQQSRTVPSDKNLAVIAGSEKIEFASLPSAYQPGRYGVSVDCADQGRSNLSDSGSGSVCSHSNNNRVARMAALFSGKEKTEGTVVPMITKKDKISASQVVRQRPKSFPDLILPIIPEGILLREVLFAFQGIEGKFIKMQPGKDRFYIDSKAGLSGPMQRQLLRLIELGWMYNKVHNFCESQNLDRALGLVGQSFIAALQEELSEYYRLLAVLESQLQQNFSIEEPYSSTRSGSLTLRQLAVWTLDPFVRMKQLATLVDACRGQRGGALASSLYSFLHHADPSICELVKHILSVVVQPIYRMLSHWIFSGELEDMYHEFFVAVNSSVPNTSLWHEKYSLRKTMVPSFLTMSQARKVLSTGKAINFLRMVCHDHSSVRPCDEQSEQVDTATVVSLFNQDQDSDFQRLLETSYKETSRHVLKSLFTQYNFTDHLLAMRRYLLLGQGDFIRHLMDLLEEELPKSANMLYLHNLSGILESAIRATNAQFDSPDILQRLDLRLLEAAVGDTGWDVFSLDYHVDGPIGTVFTPQCINAYLRLFNTLWRSKRIEYILSGMWQTQMTYSRLMRTLPGVAPVLHHCHFILTEMVHFVQQMQYYIAFEVMECSWAELQQKVMSAEDLDQVIAAHEQFLDSIMTRSLLDEESKDVLTQLRAIYDLVIRFQGIQTKFWYQALSEVDARKKLDSQIVSKTEKGNWGISEAEVQVQKQRQVEFERKVVPATKAQLRVLANSYQDMVQKFLLMIADHSDPNLRFLSFRLDFNEHYKSRNSRLQTSLTYQHRRRSVLQTSVL
ncbi:gamma-tubulin complex component 3 homolog isoform X1 [Tachypleus tridentatus]|uniref:gamma-tubulin complex component 3 homolog isoform X1 n=1 Tax=Tachypleus tridentatus TaxID=6853 RepID=UPI003FD19845